MLTSELGLDRRVKRTFFRGAGVGDFDEIVDVLWEIGRVFRSWPHLNACGGYLVLGRTRVGRRLFTLLRICGLAAASQGEAAH